MRHNRIRDLEAELMQEVCSDVKFEPSLLLLIANNNILNVNIEECQVGCFRKWSVELDGEDFSGHSCDAS